jgi:hypothetical protein
MKNLFALAGALAMLFELNGAELTASNLMAAQFKATNTANGAFGEFRAILATNNVAILGFASISEFQTATVGQPFKIYQIPIDPLKAYQSGPFNKLLKPAPRMIFPLSVSGEVKSSIVLRLQGNEWISDRFGGPELIKSLVGARDLLATQNRRFAAESFAVEIPLVALWFVGYTNNAKQVQLITPIPLKMGGLTVGTNQPLTQAFMKKLSGLANGYPDQSN